MFESPVWRGHLWAGTRDTNRRRSRRLQSELLSEDPPAIRRATIITSRASSCRSLMVKCQIASFLITTRAFMHMFPPSAISMQHCCPRVYPQLPFSHCCYFSWLTGDVSCFDIRLKMTMRPLLNGHEGFLLCRTLSALM